MLGWLPKFMLLSLLSAREREQTAVWGGGGMWAGIAPLPDGRQADATPQISRVEDGSAAKMCEHIPADLLRRLGASIVGGNGMLYCHDHCRMPMSTCMLLCTKLNYPTHLDTHSRLLRVSLPHSMRTTYNLLRSWRSIF